MKTKGVRKFLWCLKPVGVRDDDDDYWSVFKKLKPKGRSKSDGDLGKGNIFVSFNSSNGGGRIPKRNHQKIPRFLKKTLTFRKSNVWYKFGSIKSKDKLSVDRAKNDNSRELEITPPYQRNSSDSSSSIFTSSSMASSSLASSSCSFSTVPSKLVSLEMKKICPNDQELATIEEKYNYNKHNLMEKAGGCYFGSEYGICFLMLGLLILLTWGKLFAIFFTSLCLFFGHPRRRMMVIHNNPEEIFDDNMLNIEVSDKQGLMEGFSGTLQ